eukprot:CAMPEP_0198199720 /NCGR_PEP_ID=MMETSP1445-20131203/2916_1 /TAXON_ID=36898 /ORGANISM="Pyramimonas sp., Strain CCMP2087" /LENGTH=427 /DNA_ID=CAMNT_0043869611 /DNA_START=170 /DNA_END=1453 /DNA_ORIENTATION=+
MMISRAPPAPGAVRVRTNALFTGVPRRTLKHSKLSSVNFRVSKHPYTQENRCSGLSSESEPEVNMVSNARATLPSHRVLVASECDIILRGREVGCDTVEISVDLGVSTTTGRLEGDGVRLPDVEGVLAWSDIEMIKGDSNGCFGVRSDGTVERIQMFSESTGRAVSLLPSVESRTPPTALVAGFPMHRFGKGVDPREDTKRKMLSLGRFSQGATVLDICTGLGYTAIAAAEGGALVTTIELDPAMQQMCRMNPWSQGLFTSPRVTQLIGSAVDLVETFPDASFDRILHDPPTFTLAGDLYSLEFYSQLSRLLKPQGKLYHYVGDPDSKAAGRHFQGILRRLRKAGFEGAAIDHDAHGIVAAHKHIDRPKRRPTVSSKTIIIKEGKPSSKDNNPRTNLSKKLDKKSLEKMLYQKSDGDDDEDDDDDFL